MEGFSILNTCSILIPYVLRNVLGNGYRSCVWIILLFHVQESREKPITILSYALIARYVWLKFHLLINRMGILTFSKAHPGKGAFCLLKDCNYHIW